MYKEIYCYRIEAAANAARDDAGNPSEAYLSVGATYTKDRMTDAEYAEIHEVQREALATMLTTSVENVVPIGYAEYYENVEDDDEDGE